VSKLPARHPSDSSDQPGFKESHAAEGMPHEGVGESAPHILIVEDEPKLATVLANYLHLSGFTTTAIADGRDVIPYVRNRPPSLMVLDLMLPNKNGMDICRELRQFSALPVIMLTARVDEIDRLLGLELGADDYVCKPYSPREVVARVKAILRRTAQKEEHQASPGLQYSDHIAGVAHKHADAPYGSTSDKIADLPNEGRGLHVDDDNYTAELDGVSLRLTPVEFRLLSLLAKSPGRIFQRDYLLLHLYSDHRVVTDRTVDSHVKNLRRKLQAIRTGVDPIVSVYGVGYRLDV
jgi:two-component system response regulator BaeR